MSPGDEAIIKAARDFAAALTAGGKDYYVRAESIEVTRIESDGREFAYEVHVTEQSERKIV